MSLQWLLSCDGFVSRAVKQLDTLIQSHLFFFFFFTNNDLIVGATVLDRTWSNDFKSNVQHMGKSH